MTYLLLVGAGVMGRTHMNAYQKMDNVKVAGIVDLDLQKAEAIALHGEPVFSSMEEAMEQLTTIDLVDICLPTDLHHTYIKKASHYTQNIICEKPLGRNVEEAMEIIQFCKQEQINLFVGHVVRFFPEYQLTKRLLDSSKIGKPGVVRMSRTSAFPKWEKWYGDAGKSGGLILDLIIHDFDYLRWCFGEVERVYAKGISIQKVKDKDYALVTLRFKNGVIAHVEGSWTHHHFTAKFEMSGTDGVISYNSDQQKSLRIATNGEASSPGSIVQKSPLNKNPHHKELEHFIECVETNKQPLITPEDAMKAIEISMAAIRSMETGQPVTLNE
ncbi:Gfo/Idh/MocA family oxidoreductase [Gracilibacillus oryzae]|uniref:Gfo/Idh/MocA family oxidoreductase n=1 Tax=Gracilibacillus oryzae TaxID=1672701 RepID=A0A7C8GS64_9BACI|nr:Gfo/Idh/MocA family oxidoreductase [Gracilibacillus oryzae]KAB8127495.1 Gfo/Idh/MocA family oxidoreductase [Gracilibacillus oryzae]